mgnify:CR=1 FL=1
MALGIACLLVAYSLGSIPTALLVSRAVAGVDLREIGDANMGARNVFHTLGWRPALVVAVVDSGKGALSVLLGKGFDLPLEWQLAVGACAVLGHDFPAWAGFRGGQGFATTVGVLCALMPIEGLSGLVVYGLFYLITRKSDVSAGVGMALLATLVEVCGQPRLNLAYTVALLLCVPAKKVLDLPRRKRIKGDLVTPPR